MVSLLLTLNIFHTLSYCFYCWLWAGKCRLGYIWSPLIRLAQTKVHYKIFTRFEKKRLTSLKSSNYKNLFLQHTAISTTCFDKSFLFHVISGRHRYRLSLSWGSLKLPSFYFLWNKWFERSPYFIFYLQNNSAMLVSMFQSLHLL